MGATEPFWESAPLLNATLKGKKKSNGSFQSNLGWPRGGSGFWVMSTKVTIVVKDTSSVTCWESCSKKFHDRSALGSHSKSPPLDHYYFPWRLKPNCSKQEIPFFFILVLCSSPSMRHKEMSFLETVHDTRTVNSYIYFKTDSSFPQLGSCLISERPDGKTAATVCLTALLYHVPGAPGSEMVYMY